MQAIMSNLPFCYVSAPQAAWLKKFFSQPTTSFDAYLADPNIIASDPSPARFIHQLQLAGLLKTDGTDLRPTSETCACYPLIDGLHIAGDDADGKLAFYREIHDNNYLLFLMEQDGYLRQLFTSTPH